MSLLRRRAQLLLVQCAHVKLLRLLQLTMIVGVLCYNGATTICVLVVHFIVFLLVELFGGIALAVGFKDLRKALVLTSSSLNESHTDVQSIAHACSTLHAVISRLILQSSVTAPTFI